jgi:hypothetical protein
MAQAPFRHDSAGAYRAWIATAPLAPRDEAFALPDDLAFLEHERDLLYGVLHTI